MITTYYPSSERGHVNFGWLDSHHSFSFGNWHNREKVHFGALRVLNDDTIREGKGFDTHPHENMEIITIPLKGALAHKDSTGAEGIIYSGDVQIMSAGSGIRHSEYNASHYDPVTLLQIWIFPKQTGTKPRHDQRSFDPADRNNHWQIVVSPRPEDLALKINQDARLALTKMANTTTLPYHTVFPGNGIYLFLLSGQAEIDGRLLHSRDGLGVTGTDEVSIHAITDTELLAIEVPMFA
ncbi:MAG TPA: pirin family protein [Puia sp.]|jgi:redox-sensitive bicupin YhaK (pirin superfamily)|nr:pirin family protein [Puia sp.]